MTLELVFPALGTSLPTDHLYALYAALSRVVPEFHDDDSPLGNREEETAALVADYLRTLGFDDVRTGVAHTGVVAVLRGGRPGPTPTGG